MRRARILILRGGAIGDFIVTLPAIQALRGRWPDGHLELIGYPRVASLAQLGGLVNTVRSLEESRMARFFAWNMQPTDDDVSYFSSFDIVVNFLHDPDGTLQSNLKRCGVQVLLSASPLVDDLHASLHFLKPLESIAIYDADPIPRLRLPGRPAASPWIALHPGSGGRAKCWPLEHFIFVAEHMRRETSLTPVFVTGEAEVEYIGDLDRRLAGFTRLHSLPLNELAGHLQSATCFLGNDAGATHLAAALGVPTVALFGPTDASRWAPLGSHVSVIKAADRQMASISVNDVLDTLARAMRFI